MAYTSTTLVINELGTNYDNSNDLTTAHVQAFIDQADSIIDSAAYPHYNPFNAYDSIKTDSTDTYTVPGLIGQCSKNVAVAFALKQLKAKRANTTHSDTIDGYLEQAQLTLDALGAGVFLKTETWRTFSLTFGDQDPSFELDSNQSFVNPTALDSGDPPHILTDTVSVAAATGITNPGQLQNGRDYKVTWSPGWRQWVFDRYESNLVSAATVTVTFKWDYRKDYGDEPQGPVVINAG